MRQINMQIPKQGAAILLAVSLVALLVACRAVKSTVQLPGKAVSSVTQAGQKTPADPFEVQQNLLRIGDEFLAGMRIGVEKLRRNTNAFEPAEAIQWKIAFATEVTSIVSGPNAFANLLDFTVFAAVTRIGLEQHWKPNMFGESALPLIQAFQTAETNLWMSVQKVLKPEQQVELISAIEAWQRNNTTPESVLSGRAVGFAAHIASANKTESEKPGSVFNWLMLDPLAGLDPATREIAQTRLFAERALFVSQKMPFILRWQTELLSLNATRLPAVQQLLTNTTEVAATAQSFARVADQLPALVDRQRQAAIKQIFDGLASERTNLVATLAADEIKLHANLVELRTSLSNGTEFAKASDAMIKTLDSFIARFDKGTNQTASAPDPKKRPFDILDYATAAKEITLTMKELNAALNGVDKALPQLQKAGEPFEHTANRLLMRLLLVGVALIILLTVCAMLVIVFYRRSGKTG